MLKSCGCYSLRWRCHCHNCGLCGNLRLRDENFKYSEPFSSLQTCICDVVGILGGADTDACTPQVLEEKSLPFIKTATPVSVRKAFKIAFPGYWTKLNKFAWNVHLDNLIFAFHNVVAVLKKVFKLGSPKILSWNSQDCWEKFSRFNKVEKLATDDQIPHCGHSKILKNEQNKKQFSF